MRTNTLYYDDNLRVLREHIPDSSVDLIYLDPPFNSNRTRHTIFKPLGIIGGQFATRLHCHDHPRQIILGLRESHA